MSTVGVLLCTYVGEGDVEYSGILLHHGEVDLAWDESLREDLHGVDTGQEYTPELTLLHVVRYISTHLVRVA